MMRKTLLLGAALASATLPLTAARADVLAGVTAWEAGDYARAVREWRPLAESGDADAQFNLGQAYKLGRGVTQDLPQAAQWFGRAAQQGHLQAQDNYGLVLYDMNNKTEALQWLQRSAERGEPRAQFVMGAELFNGTNIARDLPRAYALMKRASDAGLQRAAAALAQMDSAIPLEQRQQGIAMATTMEQSEGQARLAAMSATTPPRPRRAPTIRPTALPPSAAGTSYTPPPTRTAPAVTTPAGPTAALPPGIQYPPDMPTGIASGTAGLPGDGTAPLPPRAGVAVHQGTPPAATGHGTNPRVHNGTPPSVRTAPAATSAANGAWRIQLGAFSSRSGAQNLWTSLAGRLAGAQPSYVAAGNITRLQAGPFASRAAAEAACSRVRPAACFAVSR
jgi:cell division septation protein DedD